MKDDFGFPLGFLSGFIAGFVLILLLMVFTIGLPKDIINEVRNEAIQAGVGHWTINPTTGEKKFVFECRGR